MVPCRTGNYLRRVSYWNEALWCPAGQETIRERFPVEMIRNGSIAGQETVREKFPIGIIRNGSMPDRKLFAKSFLWK